MLNVVSSEEAVEREIYLDIIEEPPTDIFDRVLDAGLEAPQEVSAAQLILSVVASYEAEGSQSIDERWVLDVVDRLEAAGYVRVDAIGKVFFRRERLVSDFPSRRCSE